MTTTATANRKYAFPHVVPWLRAFARFLTAERSIVLLAVIVAGMSSAYFVSRGYNIAYGDAESHLNIAKRVIDSLTPGFAQLGGIWLPLPHLLLVPFVYSDFLWRTGIAGAIVSGLSFIVSALYLYRLVAFLTNDVRAAAFGATVFMLNPNVLYLQSTPLTEPVFILFFLLSAYYFVRFLRDDGSAGYLIAAALFGFCASLTRYDGWLLVLMEAGILAVHYLPLSIPRHGGKKAWAAFAAHLRASVPRIESRVVLFSTLAFFGIVLWLGWGFLILGDPLYFSHSPFSASSQQSSWLLRGELPAYHSWLMSFIYYGVTSYDIAGIGATGLALGGMAIFLLEPGNRRKLLIFALLMTPFVFYVLTLYMGQSVIFLPGLTPASFDWTLFNVRYGVMMVPTLAIFAGYLFSKMHVFNRALMLFLIAMQTFFFAAGMAPVLALADGTAGLSSEIARIPDAQSWMARNYDYGPVLIDDYARTISIIRTPIPMKDVIYIGNQPYWQQSLTEPEKYARWIVMQQDDAVWKAINDDPVVNARLYKYFQKVYTSEQILIFKRNDAVQ